MPLLGGVSTRAETYLQLLNAPEVVRKLTRPKLFLIGAEIVPDFVQNFSDSATRRLKHEG